jgi:hypothetical protein
MDVGIETDLEKNKHCIHVSTPGYKINIGMCEKESLEPRTRNQ